MANRVGDLRHQDQETGQHFLLANSTITNMLGQDLLQHESSLCLKDNAAQTHFEDGSHQIRRKASYNKMIQNRIQRTYIASGKQLTTTLGQEQSF